MENTYQDPFAAFGEDGEIITEETPNASMSTDTEQTPERQQPVNTTPTPLALSEQKAEPTPVGQPAPANTAGKPQQPDLLNPLETAIMQVEQQEAARQAQEQERELEQKKRECVGRLPIFFYDNTESVIEDVEMTFEELRTEMATQCALLSDAKSVKWTMEYGSIQKQVMQPHREKIGSLKAQIELSAESDNALSDWYNKPNKKGKQKDFICRVIPTKKHESRGDGAVALPVPPVPSEPDPPESQEKLSRQRTAGYLRCGAMRLASSGHPLPTQINMAF